MSPATFELHPMMRRVERSAWGVILSCARAKSLSTLPLPVPIEQWIEGPLGIRFSIADLRHLGPNVLGLARTVEREIIVSDAIVDQEARFRFTAAHELGHIVLHAKVAPDFRETTDGAFKDRKIEREADRFAAAFLMPIPALCSEYPRFAADAGNDGYELLDAVSSGHEGAASVFYSAVVPRLAKLFGVSHSAAARRFCDVLLPSGNRALTFESIRPMLPGDPPTDAPVSN